jgi:hypothetical protein
MAFFRYCKTTCTPRFPVSQLCPTLDIVSITPSESGRVSLLLESEIAPLHVFGCLSRPLTDFVRNFERPRRLQTMSGPSLRVTRLNQISHYLVTFGSQSCHPLFSLNVQRSTFNPQPLTHHQATTTR